MEKQNFDNKLLKNLGKGLVDLSELMGDSMDEAIKEVNKGLTDKQKINAKLFQNKYIKHIVNGEHKEAKILQEAFKKQMNK